jgi:hypothetical protein
MPAPLSFLRPRERAAVATDSNSGSDSPEEIAHAPLPPPPPPPSTPGLLSATIVSAAAGTGGRRWGFGGAAGGPARFFSVPTSTPEESLRILSDSSADAEEEEEAEAHARAYNGIAVAAAGEIEPLVADGTTVSHPAAATATAPALKKGFGWAMMTRRPPLSPSLSVSAIPATSSLLGAEDEGAAAALQAKVLAAAARSKLSRALLPVALLAAWKSDSASGGRKVDVGGGSGGGGGGNGGGDGGAGGGGGSGKIAVQPSHAGGPRAPRPVRNSLLARSAAWQSLWAQRGPGLRTWTRSPTAAQVRWKRAVAAFIYSIPCTRMVDQLLQTLGFRV